MTRIENIEKYIQDLLGQDVVINPMKQIAMNGLPLYLSKTYTPYEMTLLDKSIVLFLRKAERSESPARIAKDAAGLQKHFEKDVAMVLDEVASWERKRLIEKQVPFIVPGRQLYLPMLLMDLRERFPQNHSSEAKVFIACRSTCITPADPSWGRGKSQHGGRCQSSWIFCHDNDEGSGRIGRS